MTRRVTSRFLDLRAWRRCAGMRFSTRRRVEGTFMGYHQSRQLGGAGEFVDFREYTGGEDLRRIDWKVLARTGKAFVRLHEEETNLDCTLVIDASGSMAFGAASPRQSAGSKLEYAQYLATALSQVISQGQDRVGLAVLDGRLHDWLAPGATASHVENLQEVVQQLETHASLRMAAGLRDLFERSRRRGVLLVMSDFLMEDLEDVFAGVRLFRHRGWDTVILHLVHPDEERLPEGAAYRFEGMEGEGRVNCSPAEIRAAYRERFAAHMAMVRQLAPGRRLRLSPRLDGHPLLEDPGRIFGREGGLTSPLAVSPLWNSLGTVPIFVRRKWDCPLHKLNTTQLEGYRTRDLRASLGNRGRRGGGGGAGADSLAHAAAAGAAAAQHASLRARGGPPEAHLAAAARSDLLALRTLAILLLAAAIARPQWGARPQVSDLEGGDAVRVVVLDVSQSMAAVSGAAQQIERARTVAAGYLRYRPGLAANLILAGARPHGVFDVPSTNFDALRDELARCRVRPEEMDANRALDLAARMFAAPRAGGPPPPRAGPGERLPTLHLGAGRFLAAAGRRPHPVRADRPANAAGKPGDRPGRRPRRRPGRRGGVGGRGRQLLQRRLQNHRRGRRGRQGLAT